MAGVRRANHSGIRLATTAIIEGGDRPVTLDVE
jgi:hypothetical protein